VFGVVVGLAGVVQRIGDDGRAMQAVVGVVHLFLACIGHAHDIVRAVVERGGGVAARVGRRHDMVLAIELGAADIA
jgi:hypothetical protein